MAPPATPTSRQPGRALWPFVSGLVAFIVTELLFAAFIGTPWRPGGALALGDAFLVALPLALPLLFAGAGAGMSLRRHGAWSVLPALVAAPCVVAVVSMNVEWLTLAGEEVNRAAWTAYQDNGFMVSHWLWNRTHGLGVVVLFPLLVVVWFVELVLVPFVVLLTPSFLLEVGVFLLKCSLLALGGCVISAAVTGPILFLVTRRKTAEAHAR